MADAATMAENRIIKPLTRTNRTAWQMLLYGVMMTVQRTIREFFMTAPTMVISTKPAGSQSRLSLVHHAR
jgi:hypothetical protein